MKLIKSIKETFQVVRQMAGGMLTDMIFPSDHTKILPEYIGEYKLVNYINSAKSRNSSYQFAIYEDVNGKKVIAKAWYGLVKNLSYYTLKSEYLIYQTLGITCKQYSGKIPKRFQNIHIPELLYYRESDSTLIMLVEYFEGQPLQLFSAIRKSIEINKCHQFLEKIGILISYKDRKNITTRSAGQMIFFYPLIIIKAFYNYPKQYKLFCYLISNFVLGFGELLKIRPNILSHRDLHDDNILINHDGSIAIIDFQFMVYTIILYDRITSLELSWQDEILRNKLLNSIEKTRISSGLSKNAVRALFAYISAHILTASNLTEAKISNCVDFAIYGLQYGNLPNQKKIPGWVKNIRIIKSYFINIVSPKRILNLTNLPSQINHYILVKPLSQKKGNPFSIGIYQKNRKQYVLKILIGREKGLHFHILKHEYEVLNTISHIQKRITGSIVNGQSPIETPKVVEFIESRSLTTLVLSNCASNYIRKNIGYDSYIKIFNNCKTFFSKIILEANSNEKQTISEKNGRYYLLIYPFILFVALIKFPNRFYQLLKSLIIVYRGIPNLLNYDSFTLVHGDLALNNIIFNIAKITILDWGQATITFPELETIATLSCASIDSKTSQILKNDLKQTAKQSRNNAKRISALIVICSIYNLAGTLPSNRKTQYLKMLDFGFQVYQLSKVSHKQYTFLPI
jgi:thiamine kinase-like enzyme